MTLSVFAAGASGLPMTGAEYRPGVSSIGLASLGIGVVVAVAAVLLPI